MHYFYDAVSFEFAGKYPADLFLLGNNVGVMMPTTSLPILPSPSSQPCRPGRFVEVADDRRLQL